MRKRIVVFIVRYSPGLAISRTIRCTGLIAADYQLRGIDKLGKAGPRGSVIRYASVCTMHVGMGQGRPRRPTNQQNLTRNKWKSTLLNNIDTKKNYLAGSFGA